MVLKLIPIILLIVSYLHLIFFLIDPLFDFSTATLFCFRNRDFYRVMRKNSTDLAILPLLDFLNFKYMIFLLLR